MTASAATDRVLLHATTIAIEGRAVLLRGASGAGKSDLGLRLIDAGARLVADDQSELLRRGDSLIVRAPATIAGLIEVRGIGIVRLDTLAEAPVALLVDLVPAETLERLPAWRNETILGLDLPRWPRSKPRRRPNCASRCARLPSRGFQLSSRNDERRCPRHRSRLSGGRRAMRSATGTAVHQA